MPSGNPGIKHPVDCPHCKKAKRTSRAIFIIGTDVPICKCHKKPMVWGRADRLKAGGTWKCSVMVKNSARKTRLKKFGISEKEYQAMLSDQNGLCAICKGPPDARWKMLAVDYCHDTGKVRGLLCMVCNTMLGRFEKNFSSVMRYINK